MDEDSQLDSATGTQPWVPALGTPRTAADDSNSHTHIDWTTRPYRDSATQPDFLTVNSVIHP